MKRAVDLPIQGQCEPPDSDDWFARMRAAGIDALGMHLEAVTPLVRARIMPGKAQVSIFATGSEVSIAVEGQKLLAAQAELVDRLLAALAEG